MSQTRIALLRSGSGQAPTILSGSPDQLAGRDLIGLILDGTLGGVLVEGAFDAALAAGVVAQLRDAPGACGPVVTPPFPGWTYGAVLVVSPPDLVAYRRRGQALLAVLSDAGLPLADQLAGMLMVLSGGVPIRTPPEASTPLTVRVFEAGDGVGIHSERADWPSMAGLRERIMSGVQLSCYTPLSLAAGGQLHLYHRPPPGLEPRIEGIPAAEAADALASFGLTEVRPSVGDLLVFDGGRYNHRVLPSQHGQRWTAGAFLASGPDGQRYAWS
ncbi:MAG: hypothetical protein P8R54_15560 [Myxococcota bacterium]|nr:hypothetical protein [Myxococcota bacterium]